VSEFKLVGVGGVVVAFRAPPALGIIHIGSMRKGTAPIGGDYIYDI
jgi:hypothetical protein